jgi:hypothetical protein
VFKDAAARADSETVGTQVSAPIRVVALVGVLAALAMGAWLMTAGRAGDDSAEPVQELRPVQAARKSVAAEPVTPSTPPKPALKLPKGTPPAVGRLLEEHRVGVVLLYDSQSKVDAYSLSEAALAAKNAGAGLLRVDVRNETLATTFSKSYGVLQAPSVLLYRRPGTLALKLNGFADHETVEQAVLNVALGLGTSSS